MRIDVRKCLVAANIGYKESGNNIGDGWIGVQHCPFCGDTRYHAAINLNSAAFSCWVCGKKAWIYEYLRAELGLTEQEVKDFGRQFFTLYGDAYKGQKRISPPAGKVLEFPSTFRPLEGVCLDYLLSRGYDISVAQRYNLQCADIIDPFWKFRVIFPFYFDWKLVAWTGRTIFPDVDPRYKNISNKQSLMDVRATLYNIDALARNSILVEGPTDVLRIGSACAAVIGLEFTNAQVYRIKERGVERVSIVFDGEEKAVKRAIRLAKCLDMVGIHADVVRLPDGMDPGSMSDSEAADLRKECGVV